MMSAINASYDWSQFDSEAYFQHYYGEPHSDDDAVIASVCHALARFAPFDGRFDVMDVGTGPNLYPLMATLPLARSVTAYEYSSRNVEWLRRELVTRNARPQWAHFWGRVKAGLALTDWPDTPPMEALFEKTSVKHRSIFDLPGDEPERDIATMFFCAESITSSYDEFAAACRAFAQCVKPGGLMLAAFLVNSDHYDVAGRGFPILNIDAGDVRAAFIEHAVDISLQPIGIVSEQIRSGYSGFVFMTATRRTPAQTPR